jgi:hypothetical protein
MSKGLLEVYALQLPMASGNQLQPCFIVAILLAFQNKMSRQSLLAVW